MITKQSVRDLHTSGYPVLAFYVDHMIAMKISKFTFKSLEGMWWALISLVVKLSNDCRSYAIKTNHHNTLCGAIHLHNLNDLGSTRATWTTYTIHVPHFFYIHAQLLEIILVGGLAENACFQYQSFRLWYMMIYPFSSNETVDWDKLYVFCGTHLPFTSIIPGNYVILEAVMKIQNTYASINMRYTVVDLMVSKLIKLVYFLI